MDDRSYTERLNELLNRADFLDDLCGFIANGGSHITFCELKDIRFSDLMSWVGKDERRNSALAAADLQRVEFIKHRVELELAHISFTDIRRLYQDDGTLLPPSQWPPEIARAIGSIESEELFEGTGKERKWAGYTKKVRMLDKIRALELIGKERGMFADKVKHEGTLTLEQLVAASRAEPDKGGPQHVKE